MLLLTCIQKKAQLSGNDIFPYL